MNPRAFIMHTPDGAFACDPVPVRDFEQTLRGHFGNERRLLRSVFTLDGDTVDVAVGPTDSLCGVRLKNLTLDTYFTQVGEFLVPTFRADGVRLKLDWPVPDSMRLTFASRCELMSNWVERESFLFTRGPEPGFRKPPLPNIYEDGRVCMGDAMRGLIRGTTLVECFKMAVETFGKTVWNEELNNNQSCVRALFRWKPDRTPVPPPAGWERLCQTCSRLEMEALCPQ